MRLTFKNTESCCDEEMYHGIVSQEVLDELKEISENITRDNNNNS